LLSINKRVDPHYGPKETSSYQIASRLFKEGEIVYAYTIDEVFFRLGEMEIKEALFSLAFTVCKFSSLRSFAQGENHWDLAERF